MSASSWWRETVGKERGGCRTAGAVSSRGECDCRARFDSRSGPVDGVSTVVRAQTNGEVVVDGNEVLCEEGNLFGTGSSDVSGNGQENCVGKGLFHMTLMPINKGWESGASQAIMDRIITIFKQ